jgi:phosphatidylserine decarboxylase
MKIHPAGYRTIFISVLLLISVNALLYLIIPLPLQWLFIMFGLPAIVLIILILRFFRYPSRKPSDVSEQSVLAAADGVVVVVERVIEDRFLKGEAIQISTFMSPLNVHLNWVPVSGVAEEVAYLPGKYLLASNPKSSMLNEMSCVLLSTVGGQKILVRQIAGFVARRIIPFLKSGDMCQKGDELGFIRFGSRVDVLVPVGSEIKVVVGERVKGMETVLAHLV